MAMFMAKMRAAFGDESVDDAVPRGKAVEAALYACEKGRTVRTAGPVSQNVWRVNADIRSRHYCLGFNGGCVELGMSLAGC
jgi:hypothetical protein